MSAISAARLQALFASVIDLPEGDREAFLLEACDADEAALLELRSLLAMDHAMADRTIRPIAPELARMVVAAAPAESLVGMRVGAFELGEELGHGGMGSV